MYSVLEIVFVLSSLWLIIFFIGHVLTVSKVLVIKSMTDLSLVIPFPAALGTLEMVQAFVFKAFGLKAATGIALSLIYRGLSLVMAFFGILVFGFFHFRMYIQRFVERTVSFIKLITNNEDSKL